MCPSDGNSFLRVSAETRLQCKEPTGSLCVSLNQARLGESRLDVVLLGLGQVAEAEGGQRFPLPAPLRAAAVLGRVAESVLSRLCWQLAVGIRERRVVGSAWVCPQLRPIRWRRSVAALPRALLRQIAGQSEASLGVRQAARYSEGFSAGGVPVNFSAERRRVAAPESS